MKSTYFAFAALLVFAVPVVAQDQKDHQNSPTKDAHQGPPSSGGIKHHLLRVVIRRRQVPAAIKPHLLRVAIRLRQVLAAIKPHQHRAGILHRPRQAAIKLRPRTDRLRIMARPKPLTHTTTIQMRTAIPILRTSAGTRGLGMIPDPMILATIFPTHGRTANSPAALDPLINGELLAAGLPGSGLAGGSGL